MTPRPSMEAAGLYEEAQGFEGRYVLGEAESPEREQFAAIKAGKQRTFDFARNLVARPKSDAPECIALQDLPRGGQAGETYVFLHGGDSVARKTDALLLLICKKKQIDHQ